MPTDGPADPNPAGRTSSDSEGSIFDRLRSPVRTDGTERADAPGGETDLRQGQAPDAATAYATAGAGHTPVDSARGNPQVLAASREAGGIALAPAGTRAVDVQGPRIEDRDPRKEKAAERQASMLFTLSVLAVVAFIVCFVYGDPHHVYFNPVLGGTMGVALLGVGMGAVVWAKKLMPDEEAVQEREPHFSPQRDQLAAAETFRKGVAESGIAQRPLLRRTLLAAVTALGALAVVTLRSLGPFTSNQAAGELAKTSWRKGLKMIDISNMQPAKLGEIAVGGFITVIPEGTEEDEQAQSDSVAILIRLRPDELHPVKGHEDLDFAGHVVYSKLCSHLGCPVSLYEQQTHKLLCPCHQSQFLADESARPVFGPADRRLAQLAVTVDKDGYFIARDGDFPEPVGPGYWERT